MLWREQCKDLTSALLSAKPLPSPCSARAQSVPYVSCVQHQTCVLLLADVPLTQIISQGGEAKEREYASKLIPLRKRGNLLLCTLLLGNTAVNSAISILLSEVSSGLVGLVVSTSVILVLGELFGGAGVVLKTAGNRVDTA